jgi:hypothetical protein
MHNPWCDGRYHAVQLSSDDPNVDVRARHHVGNAAILKPSERDPSVAI